MHYWLKTRNLHSTLRASRRRIEKSGHQQSNKLSLIFTSGDIQLNLSYRSLLRSNTRLIRALSIISPNQARLVIHLARPAWLRLERGDLKLSLKMTLTMCNIIFIIDNCLSNDHTISPFTALCKCKIDITTLCCVYL